MTDTLVAAHATGLEIAIIGMEGRFPGARSLAEFWQNLKDGVESVRLLSDQELDAAGVAAAERERPDYVRLRPILDDVELFDAAFFGYTPREAEVMDPQQRLFLECAWTALERAGCDAEQYRGTIGVYAGVNINSYLLNLYASSVSRASLDDLQALLGNDKDYLATRVSYKLNLNGPSVAVQTACSTALVAVHMACRALLGGECDMALAGGVSISLPQTAGYRYQEGGLYSPDGHCRAFDAKAQGTMFGSGIGLVVLKRLDDALADRDSIHAVIKGSAINNDGALKVGFTAPGGEGQLKVITAAQALAEIDPATIGYVEAHGTATPLGDTIEFTALARAFRAGTQKQGFCALGSVKTNIGHLNTAAGAAGLIKTALMLEHKQIPPSLHFERPNPAISFAGSPFYVNTRLAAWRAGQGPRRAGVSSFGVGGTNAHVVLEEAPPAEPSGPSRPWQLLPLSAKTATALEAATANLAAHLREHPDLDLADAAYTLQAGRRRLSHRRTLVCRDRADALAQLEAPQALATAYEETTDRAVVFMFPGGGAQYTGMGAGLYAAEPVFRAAVDECAELLRPHLGHDIRDVLYPTMNDEGRMTNDEGSDSSFVVRRSSEQALTRTGVALPALFTAEYAMARLWMSWGIVPAAMIGHSLGEYTAACLSGVLDLEDALKLVVLRGRLMEQLPAGAMLSVPLPEAEARALLTADLSLAAINGPAQCVISGPSDAIEALAATLEERAIEFRRLRIDVAAHSELVAPILDTFTRFVARLRLHQPRIPYISNVSGTWITAAEATDPRYWGRHLRQTVRFGDGIAELLRQPSQILLEVGPGQTLTTLAKLQLGGERAQAALGSMRHPYDRQPDQAFALAALGRLWQAGARIDWAGFCADERRRRVALPTYPFERQRYWIDGAQRTERAASPPAQPGKRPNIADWFYIPSWKRSLPPRPATAQDLAARPRRWLVFADACGLGDQMLEQLAQAGQEAVAVTPGERFECSAPDRYRIDPRRRDDYAALLAELRAAERLPDTIAHLWSVAPAQPGGAAAFEQAQDAGFYSLLYLAQALDRSGAAQPLQLWVATSNAQQVESGDRPDPARATILGPCKVIPQEYEQITCGCIDLVVPAPGAHAMGRLAARLLAEMSAAPADPLIAYRGEQRWVQSFESVRLERDAAPARTLRERGVYLITGGLGRVGLQIADELARSARARLILVGRTPLPARDEWGGWLAAHAGDDPISRAIGRVQALEQRGAEVLVASADVAREADMRAVLAQAEERFGALHGIIHAAGNVSQAAFKLIAELDRAGCELHFQAKALGLYVLAEILRGRQLDFCLLCSSNAAVLGGLGFAGYAAANLFMDSFAAAHNGRDDVAWISANWDGWRAGEGTGLSTPFQTSLDQYAMRPTESADAFRRVVSLATVAQVVVSTGDLASRLSRWIGREEPGRSARGEQAAQRLHARPALASAYAAPATEYERALAEIWQELLGIERVGIDDNFFALGGHSLLATRVVARVREVFRIELPLRSFFEAPTVAELARALQERSQRAAPTPTIPRRPAGDAWPLSYAQERLWFLDQLAPGGPLYNEPAAMRLSGALDLARLWRSFEAIIRRHEVLRTVFPARDGQPVQVVAPASRPGLRLADLRALPADRCGAMVEQIGVQEIRRPFDLARGPLLRILLLRLAEQEHALLLTMHHIISDGWSMGVFVRELAALYAAGGAAPPAALPDLPIQYADYAVWQREWLRGERRDQQLAYWRAQLEGAPMLLDLPADRPRSLGHSFDGARQTLIIPADQLAAVHALSQQEGATLFMTLLAAFATVLARYSGQEDMLIGTRIAGRTHTAAEPLIGFFLNALVLRIGFAGAPTFRALLAQVRATALEAYAHQDLPFEELVRELQPARDLIHQPLFQVMFLLQNTPVPSLTLPGLALRPLKLSGQTARYDLDFSLSEGPDGLIGTLDYSADLFDADRIARLLRHFAALLAAAAAAPDRPLAGLPLLSAAERHQLLHEWTATGAANPHDSTLPELFAVQVARAPDAIAIACADQQLSYRALAGRAASLAAHLRAHGAGPDAPVGMYLDRSLASALALLGILQAGAAVVPLDPSYPVAWLAHILADTRLALLLTTSAHARRLPPHQARVLRLDAKAGAPAPLPTFAPPHPDQALAIMYTSGSTGAPKGVVLPHRQMLNRCAWTWQRYPFAAGEIAAQRTSVNFTPSLPELLAPLLAGVRTVILPDAVVADSAALVAALRDQRISRIGLVPALLQLLLDHGGALGQALRHLRLVSVGGEALTADLLARFYARLPQATLLNQYGASEVNDAVVYDTRALRPGTAHAPIGRPIANIRAYVLDRRLQSVPIGIVGELYLASVGLARGYLNRPDLTAERFVPDPFTTNDVRCPEGAQTNDESSNSFFVPRPWSGTRLYKTGDLARYQPDGTLEYLGRRDGQIKLRGVRIELAGLEALLRRHPAVRECAVVVREDAPGQKRLVAYVVPANDERPTTNDEGSDSSFVVGRSSLIGELRAFLGERLPAAHVPTTFVLLDALPRTPNGKIDRRMLPAPQSANHEPAEAFVAPRTPTEQALAAIWQQVLGAERMGVHDDFFALGGHSLLATQVVSRLRDAFHADLPLRALFEAPTIAALAARVELAGQRGPAVSPITPAGRDQVLPLSFAQQRLWFLDQLEPGSAFYNVPATVRIGGALDVPALRRSLAAIMRRHEALRTTFAAPDGQPVQIIAPARPLPSSGIREGTPRLFLLDLRALPEPTREAAALRLATAEALRPFDLARGPLLRAGLLRLGPDEHVLLLTMHHIVSDGWSTRVLVRELAALYAAFIRGEPAPLPALPIQYADYAIWQREWLRGAALDAQLAYWRRSLADVPPLALPTDRPRTPAQRFEGARQSLALPRDLADALRAVSRREGVTLFMTMLAAWKLLLARLSGQDDIAIGTPIAGRVRPETEGLIGFFVNTLVLRTDLSGDPTFAELARRVREVALGAYAHQDLPFEKLVEELQPRRDRGRNPFFDVLFNFLDSSQVVLAAPGLTLRPIQTEPESRFPITLYVDEVGDELGLRLVYQRALFSAERIAGLLGQYQHLLAQIAAAPQQPIGSYSLVTPEARRLLPDPAAPLPAPEYELVTTMFLAWAARMPQQPALRQDGDSMSYSELARRAADLAAALLAAGLARGDVVAVCGPRSFGLIAGMLAAFLSGGVLLPIDRNLPQSRQRVMLDEARAKFVLYAGPLRAEDHWLRELPAALIAIDLDDRPLGLAAETSAASAGLPTLAPRDPAYIFFTSGTTGVPKGVLGWHNGLSHFLTWQRETFGIGPHDRAAQLTGLSFNVLLRDVFTPLTSGATLCLPPLQDEFVPDRVLTWLEREQITLIHTVPSLAQSWLSQPPAGVSLRALRWIFSAGEPLAGALVQRWRAAFPESPGQFVLLYGQTETTLAKCFYPIPDEVEPGVQPVGRPLPHTQALVLAPGGQLCGLAEPGEVVMRTPYRSLGYINAPEEQRRRFVRNPLREDGRDLLYYTGDRGRYRLDGSLEILGRVDHQVKIRGMRVEPDEVQAWLGRHPAVQAAIVVVRENRHAADGATEKSLVAYVVPTNDQRPTTNEDVDSSFVLRPSSFITELRGFLIEHLPAYMVPSAFVLLDALPLTPNGKVDRRGLPAPDALPADPARPFVAPRTPVEAALAQTWAEILGLERVSIHDDFFALGGHSLLATQVASRLRAAFQVDLPLRSLFEATTVAELAELIERARSSQGERRAPVIARRSREQHRGVVAAQKVLALPKALKKDVTSEEGPQQ